MILRQNPETGYWTRVDEYFYLSAHSPDKCEGRLCDVHDRRGPEPWASWPLNWREDRGMMEVIDPESGIGHPTRAQRDYWYATLNEQDAQSQMVHGCNGGCSGLYD